ncbi:ultraviolet-B receptor UVR8 [Tetranychus urticae]|uniref:RCC1-like domain-containing protein n=1 Tax=Tetranychus urticae TaxID=32264 RepID=T1KZX9_TETUR|nr:ultraviolet-B receptor UVR8 [Tetranychus urticae]
MLELFHCGYHSHLRLIKNEIQDAEASKVLFYPLDKLDLDEKYGHKVKKAFIGWCSLFIITESGHLLYLASVPGPNCEPLIRECNLSKSWDLKRLECGNKDVFLVLSDRKLKRWRSQDYQAEPELVDQLNRDKAKVQEISIGSSFVCVLMEDGSVIGMDEDETPVAFKLKDSSDVFVSISCGHEHILLLTRHGLVYSYGRGSKGQLGLGSLEDVFDEHKEVEALSGLRIMQISAGGWHSLALSEFGDIYAWGWNESGQLGVGGNQDASKSGLPTLIEIDVNFTSISCGSRHSMGISEEGSLYAWGWNKWGQLGLDPDEVKSLNKPTKIDFDRKVTSISCKYWSSLIEAIN